LGADLEKKVLSSKINFKKKIIIIKNKIFCKTILLAVRRQSVKRIVCVKTQKVIICRIRGGGQMPPPKKNDVPVE